jgi:uncharacterized protein (DUF58 family)
MATVLLSMPLASYIIGKIILYSCKATREQSIIATQGEPTTSILKIQSLRGYIPTEITITDSLPRSIQADKETEVDLIEDHETEVRLRFTPMKRGRFQIGPAQMSAFDPLRMFRQKRSLPGKSDLIVYPRAVKFRIAELSHGYKQADMAYHSGRLAQQGDFAGVRDYYEGDELKRVHWKTTARTQRLTVVENEDATTGSITVVLDQSQGSDFGSGMVTSFDVAVGAAAYAVRECLKRAKQARLITVNGSTVTTMELRDMKDLSAALTILAEAQANSPISGPALVKSCERCENMIFITTQPTAQLATAVAQIASRGVGISVAVVDPQPFGKNIEIGPMVAELKRTGARVELIREVGQC